MANNLLSDLAASIENGDRVAAAALTRSALEAGIPAMSVLNDGLLPAMRVVGEKFSTGEYFLPDMLVAAASMKAAMTILDPALSASGAGPEARIRVAIGTVRGDIHEIGKSLVGTMLGASVFDVIDLGVDVPAERFVEAVADGRAALIGLSALLTTTMGSQKTVIDALSAAGLRDRVKVMVGGAPVTEKWARDIGADGYAADAVTAVALARRLAVS
ncbi:MAG: corrinoid protein [Vicinamibacterales bacterium]|nr:corrinoid protein [Vicinamibacterales bacterium]